MGRRVTRYCYTRRLGGLFWTDRSLFLQHQTWFRIRRKFRKLFTLSPLSLNLLGVVSSPLLKEVRLIAQSLSTSELTPEHAPFLTSFSCSCTGIQRSSSCKRSSRKIQRGSLLGSSDQGRTFTRSRSFIQQRWLRTSDSLSRSCSDSYASDHRCSQRWSQQLWMLRLRLA